MTEIPSLTNSIGLIYWKPLDEIVEFKREIYEKVLTELEPAYKSEFSK